MRSLSDDTTGLDEGDLVGKGDRRRSRGDDDRRGLREVALEVVEDLAFSAGIEGARRVVEEQHARLADEGAGEGDALSLPAGQADTALTDRRVDPLRQLADELVRLRSGECRLHRLFVERVPECQVVTQRRRQQKRLLEHE